MLDFYFRGEGRYFYFSIVFPNPINKRYPAMIAKLLSVLLSLKPGAGYVCLIAGGISCLTVIYIVIFGWFETINPE